MTRGAFVFVVPAGARGPAEGWTVNVRETCRAGRPAFEVCSRMWGQFVRDSRRKPPGAWEGPRYSGDHGAYATLGAARAAACALVFVFAGAMSWDGLARRCPRGRAFRDGRAFAAETAPWRWLDDGTAVA